MLQLDEAACSAGRTGSGTSGTSGSCGGTPTCGAGHLVQQAAEALVAAFLQLPAQVLCLQASRLAFALPTGSQSASTWPAHPHQLRYVQGGGFGALLAASLPHWRALEAAPVDCASSDSPAVLHEAPSGVTLCKRSVGGPPQCGVFCLPPLPELAAADVSDLALAAAPTGARPAALPRMHPRPHA